MKMCIPATSFTFKSQQFTISYPHVTAGIGLLVYLQLPQQVTLPVNQLNQTGPVTVIHIPQ